MIEKGKKYEYDELIDIVTSTLASLVTKENEDFSKNMKGICEEKGADLTRLGMTQMLINIDFGAKLCSKLFKKEESK